MSRSKREGGNAQMAMLLTWKNIAGVCVWRVQVLVRCVCVQLLIPTVLGLYGTRQGGGPCCFRMGAYKGGAQVRGACGQSGVTNLLSRALQGAYP